MELAELALEALGDRAAGQGVGVDGDDIQAVPTSLSGDGAEERQVQQAGRAADDRRPGVSA